MTKKKPDLESAYALDGPQANRALYASWAQTYDGDFAEAEGYLLPDAVADQFAALGGRGPVLDVGAGTGLVGVALARHGIAPVDGMDLSPEMLAVAEQKGCYRRCFPADVTDPAAMPVEAYEGAVSAGTFTLGHVGPEGLETVIGAVRPGGLIIISVNEVHFEAAGFARYLSENSDSVVIETIQSTRIYTDQADPKHRSDMAKIVSLRST